jgi:hypothetical protein
MMFWRAGQTTRHLCPTEIARSQQQEHRRPARPNDKNESRKQGEVRHQDRTLEQGLIERDFVSVIYRIVISHDSKMANGHPNLHGHRA